MKMVKSLLLVSAAGLVASAGAQAADLPVKAKPVEYVKVCSLYGAGFYYIPGTDICMKIGGYVRYQISGGMGSSPTSGPFAGSAGFNNRINDNNETQRARVVVAMDTRQQTAYGTLRTYLSIGYSQDTNTGTTTNPTNYANRGFIQIAGFTMGKATSYFDFVSTAAVAYNAGMAYAPDTGDAGQIGLWYTATMGNGVSASFGIEQSKRTGTLYAGSAATGAGETAFTAAAFAGGTYAAFDNLGVTGTAGSVASNPDVVGNIRIDQAWGAAQLSGVVHDVSAGYYGTGPVAAVNQANGHPGDKWGWGISPGIRINFPMIGPGDYFQAAVVYTQGAFGYASNTPNRTSTGGGAWSMSFSGSNAALGGVQDAVFSGTAAADPNGIQLTTAWSVFASYEHFWTPALRTSLYGSYLGVSNNATGNAMLCNAMITGGIIVAGSTCNTNWSSWNIGSRAQWNMTRDFYLGLDVMYDRINTEQLVGPGGTAAIIGPGGASGVTGFYNASNQNAVIATFRAHRDIVP